MAKYLIEDTTLTAIGDAVRSANGTTELIPANEMATVIEKLNQGQYVWKKYTLDSNYNIGEFIDYVVSDKADQYPENGAYQDYWYEATEGAEDLEEEVKTQEDIIAEILATIPYKGVEVVPAIYYSSQDITAGTTELETGKLYFVYNTEDIAAGSTELGDGELYFVYE